MGKKAYDTEKELNPLGFSPFVHCVRTVARKPPTAVGSSQG